MTALSQRKRNKKLIPALILPLMLLLSGCMKFHLAIDLESEDQGTLAMEVVDTMGFLELATEGCSELSSPDDQEEVEEFTDDDGNAGCRMSGPIEGGQDVDGFGFYKEGDELVFTLGDASMGMEEFDELDEFEDFDLDDPAMEMFSPDILIAVTFPNEPTYASGNGKIDGKTVSWEGFEAFTEKIEARAPISGSGIFGGDDGDDEEEETVAPGESGGTEEEPTDEEAVVDDQAEAQPESSSSSFPLWLVITLGVLLLLVLFLIVMVARGRKKTPPPNAPGGFPSGPGGLGAPQQFAPQQGQFPGQGGQQPGQYPPPPPPQAQPGQPGWEQTQEMPPPPPPPEQWNQNPPQ